ncbi:MAG: hypothetical protein NTZ50_14190 [Chloroflexi bacterium]|nr:hypothetical protein [Chloroflexota bacterium]
MNPELQIAAEPNGDRFIAWTSFGARFVDTPNAIECDLVVNRVEGRPDRPLIDVKWSRDGRFVALLMLADFDRLGPTVLRILDVQKGVWHDVAVGELAVSSVTWVPGRSVALVTAADLGAADGMDVMFVVDAESGAVARVDNAPVLFTPAYWGVRFSPDGTQLAASCVVPDPDGVVRRGSLCAWEVALP